MKNKMNSRLDLLSPSHQRACSLLLSLALITGMLFVVPIDAQQQVKSQHLSDDQRIMHVLNRLGFGARPGDVERVRQMGVERYIDLQLHPEKIDDAVAEAKVAPLSSLAMSNAELFAKYPQPGKLIKDLQKRGDLPADLAAARDNRKSGDENKKTTANPNSANPTNASAMAADQSMKNRNANALEDLAKNADKKEYGDAIRNYYLEHNLLPPQRLTADLQASRILRAVYSERQLQEVLVDFWSNHFNIFAGKGADRWLLISYDRDTIRPHTMGKFADLLTATAQSPAMLFYLDNFQSVSPNAAQGDGGLRQQMRRDALNDPRILARAAGPGGNGRFNRNRDLMRQPQQSNIRAGQVTMPPPKQQAQRPKRGINENYARELMELHTLGVDGGYTQKDVQEVARCFTGWTIFDPRGYGAAFGLTNQNYAGKFYFNPRLHDDGEKLVLGHKIPAGGGVKDGFMVLDILAHHPSTAKFIATKLCRRFVADDPSPALVARVADAFTKSDGDIRETLRAIFTSPEFNSPEDYRAKIKTPFELAVSALRAVGGETNGSPALHQWIAKMGEPLYQYQAPTGYPDKAENWVNTGALLERLNFALALVGNRIPGTRVDLSRFAGNPARNGTVDRARIVDQFASLILQGDVSPKTKATLLKQLNDATATMPTAAVNSADALSDEMMANNPDSRSLERRVARREMLASNNAPANNPEVARIAALILGSPEFQRQ